MYNGQHVATQSKSEVNLGPPLQVALADASWEHCWEEAELGCVLQYCWGSKRLSIPPEWQEFDRFARSLG